MDKINYSKATYISALTVFSAIGAEIANDLGGWDAALVMLIRVIAIDFVLGIVIALVWHCSPKSEDGAFESSASLKGLFRKGAILLIVYIAVQLDMLTHSNGYIRTAVILFFIANEGFSIIENLGIMGIPLPPVIKNAFSAIKKQSGSRNIKH